MADLSSMMADAASQLVKAPSNDDLLKISQLANEQVALETRYSENTLGKVGKFLADNGIILSVPELEALLKSAKEDLAKIREYDLPNALDAVGLSEFKLLDGTLVSVKEDVFASISEENRDAAFKWLEDTDNDGIIKNEFKLPFGKGQDDEAKALQKILDEFGYSYSNSRSVHYQTLKAFVKQRLEAGEPIPLDTFSVYVKKISKITFQKKR